MLSAVVLALALVLVLVLVLVVVVVEVLVVVRMFDIRQGPGVSQSFVYCAFSALKSCVRDRQTNGLTNPLVEIL